MMKKVGLLAAFVFLMAIPAQAQNPSDLIQFGAKGGVNFSTVAGDGFESPDSRTGFHIGGLVEIPFSDRFSVQPEIMYSAQGFEITDNPNGPDVEYQLDYIQVPVLAKVYLIQGLNVQLGPQIGFLVNDKIDYGDVEVGSPEDSDGLNDFDFGIAAGLEYKFAGGFFVQGRYNYGISDLVDNSDSHNSVIQAGIGYMF